MVLEEITLCSVEIISEIIALSMESVGIETVTVLVLITFFMYCVYMYVWVCVGACINSRVHIWWSVDNLLLVDTFHIPYGSRI